MESLERAVCTATNYSPWLGVNVSIDAHHLQSAITHPDAIQMALQLGRLDLASALLGAVAVVLAILGLLGYNQVASRSREVARDEARRTTAQTVSEFLQSESGLEIVRRALRDPEFVARLQGELRRSGIADASTSGDIELSNV